VLPLDATSFDNGYPTTEKVVCSTVREERVYNSCAACISHTISRGTTQQSIHFRLLQEIRAERGHLLRQESWSALCVWCNCGQTQERIQFQFACFICERCSTATARLPLPAAHRSRVDPLKECESCGNVRFRERKSCSLLSNVKTFVPQRKKWTRLLQSFQTTRCLQLGYESLRLIADQ
jgi:hypothetical protein